MLPKDSLVTSQQIGQEPQLNFFLDEV